jgi:hypothetical protein
MGEVAAVYESPVSRVNVPLPAPPKLAAFQDEAMGNEELLALAAVACTPSINLSMVTVTVVGCEPPVHGASELRSEDVSHG